MCTFFLNRTDENYNVYCIIDTTHTRVLLNKFNQYIIYSYMSMGLGLILLVKVCLFMPIKHTIKTNIVQENDTMYCKFFLITRDVSMIQYNYTSRIYDTI